MASTKKQIHRTSVRIFSVVFILVGAAIIARTLTSGGGVLALGVVLGLMFIVLGLARLVMSRR